MSSFIDKLKKKSSETMKMVVTDSETRDNRLSICQDCEHLIKATDQCSKCGCFVKAKTWLLNSKCPLDKW